MDTNKANGIPAETVIPDKKGWVDARSIYREFGIKGHFTIWIKRRIKQYGFIQGVDYYQLSLIPSDHRGGTREDKYYLSQDMAEKLTAVEHSYRDSGSISTFIFGDRKMRVFNKNGELWFLTKDICNIFGIKRVHPQQYDAESKLTVVTTIAPKKNPGVFQMLNEYGLLRVAFRSKTPNDEISKWLVNEALPQIRKAFTAPDTQPSIHDRLRRFIKSLRKEKEGVK